PTPPTGEIASGDRVITDIRRDRTKVPSGQGFGQWSWSVEVGSGGCRWSCQWRAKRDEPSAGTTSSQGRFPVRRMARLNCSGCLGEGRPDVWLRDRRGGSLCAVRPHVSGGSAGATQQRQPEPT